MTIVKPDVEMWSITFQALELLERVGRAAYQSADHAKLGPEPFLKMILKRGHESVIEHAVATFSIITDRGVTHEIVRHRIASYTQESTRYCNYAKAKFGGEIKVIEPPFAHADSLEGWKKVVGMIESEYVKMIASGEKPEIARSILPNCLKSQIIMTANFREWRHFLHLRTAKTAHPQMQVIANMIYRELSERYPVIFKNIGKTDENGCCKLCGQKIIEEAA